MALSGGIAGDFTVVRNAYNLQTQQVIEWHNLQLKCTRIWCVDSLPYQANAANVKIITNAWSACYSFKFKNNNLCENKDLTVV